MASVRDIIRRYRRLFAHIIYPVYKTPGHLRVNGITDWLVDMIFYLIDILFLPEIFLLINYVFKSSMRKLNDDELNIAQSIYDDKLDYKKIYVDDDATFLTKKYHFAYVSFNIINYTGFLHDYILIHELMHVYQYQRFGSVYIYRAVKVQAKKGNPYDYGGFEGLVQAYKQKKSLFDFNFEQQASIIEHYYVYKNDIAITDKQYVLPVYQYFFKQL